MLDSTAESRLMPYRIKNAYAEADGHGSFSGFLEVDEAGSDGNRPDISNAQRAELVAMSRSRVGKSTGRARRVAPWAWSG